MKITRNYNLPKILSIRLEEGSSVSLKNSKEFLGRLVQFSWRLISICFVSDDYRKLASRIKFAINFGSYLLALKKRHGEVFVITYLKTSVLAIQRRVAGVRSSPRELAPQFPLPRYLNGLPAIIPQESRKAILAKNVKEIRWWLTLFSIYRIISIDSKVKLNTITDPFSGDIESTKSLGDSLSRLTSSLLPSLRSDFSILRPKRVLPITKASPSNTESWKGFFTDISALSRYPQIYQSMISYSKEIGSDFHSWMEMARIKGESVVATSQGPTPLSSLGSFKPSYANRAIGQLSFKTEAAGKVRTFALVDLWTQSLLYPLHKYLQRVLRKLPNDGTFDQNAASVRVREKAIAAGQSYGYDLSAATDRLPLSIQVDIMTSLTNRKIALLWAFILTGREYHIYDNPEQLQRIGAKPGALTYQVGQPMGAYSSWCMLAITHHMIAQLAARLAGKSLTSWYEGYEVVGDDIIFFDKAVGAMYLSIMESLGVPINLSKSVIAPCEPVAEFVKRFSVGNTDCSPLSWGQFYQLNNQMGRVSLAHFLSKRDMTRQVGKLIELTVTHKKGKRGKTLNAWINLLAIKANHGDLSYEDFLRFLIPSWIKDHPFMGFIPFGTWRTIFKQTGFVASGVKPVTIVNQVLTNDSIPSGLKKKDSMRYAWWSLWVKALQIMWIDKVVKEFSKATSRDFFPNAKAKWLSGVFEYGEKNINVPDPYTFDDRLEATKIGEELSWVGIGLTDTTHDFPYLDSINLRTLPASDEETGEILTDWVWPRANELTLNELVSHFEGAQSYVRYYNWMDSKVEAKAVNRDMSSFFDDLRRAQKLIVKGRVPMHAPVLSGRWDVS